MFDNSIGQGAPYTGSYGYGVSTAGERKAIRGQKIEESLMAPVAAPGAEEVQNLSSFYNRTLACVDQLRHPCDFPAIDKNGGTEASADSPQSSTGTSTPSNVRYLTGREAQEQADEIKEHVQGEIGRLIKKDQTKQDLDKRKGHVHVDYVEGDGYKATLDYDPKTRKPLHMESQVDGGRTWKYGYDSAKGSTPDAYYRETISPLTPENEGDPIDESASQHLKQTIITNKDGTVTVREEESVEPNVESD
jgi:hypothetical protein